jgi:hypothetical protein
MRRVLGCSLFLLIALGLPSLLLAVLGWGIWTYHELVRSEIRVEQHWAALEAAGQRRIDLIPQAVAQCRSTGEQSERFADAADVRERALRTLTSPGVLDDERAVAAVADAQAEVGAILDRLAACEGGGVAAAIRVAGSDWSEAGRLFDEAVQRHNRTLAGFPSRLVAGVGRLQPKCRLTAAPAN